MIEWALIAFVIAAPTSAAATKIHAAHLKHKRWETEKSLECPHVWSQWEEGKTTNVWASPPGSYPTTQHIRHKRTCEMCGDIDYKVWDTLSAEWL